MLLIFVCGGCGGFGVCCLLLVCWLSLGFVVVRCVVVWCWCLSFAVYWLLFVVCRSLCVVVVCYSLLIVVVLCWCLIVAFFIVDGCCCISLSCVVVVCCCL